MQTHLERVLYIPHDFIEFSCPAWVVFFSPHLEKILLLRNYFFYGSDSNSESFQNVSQFYNIFWWKTQNCTQHSRCGHTRNFYKYTMFSVLFSYQWSLILYLISACLLIILYQDDVFIELSVNDNTISLWQNGVKIKVNSESITLYLKLDSFLHFFFLHKSSCALLLPRWLGLPSPPYSSSQLLRDYTTLNSLVSAMNFATSLFTHSSDFFLHMRWTTWNDYKLTGTVQLMLVWPEPYLVFPLLSFQK